MKGKRQSIKDVFVVAAVCVIVPHVDEQSLFVVEMLVEFKAVVDLLELLFALVDLVSQVDVVDC